jgi:Protein of unknown function (DUF1549)/Protein of unknown function (DUF1553)
MGMISVRPYPGATLMGKRDLLFAVLILGGAAVLAANLAPLRARPTADARKPAPPRPDIVVEVDRAFRARWQEQGLTPASIAPELAVMRRLSLALTGTIPSLEEIRRLEARPQATRLARWLDDLLLDRRSADYLAERFARAFVGIEGGPFIVYRRRKFVTWLSDGLYSNRPYDQIVRDLIAGKGIWTDQPSTNFISVTFDPDKKTYDAERLAARVARSFLGVRIDCAQCHDHPFQPWKRADFRGIAAYFGQLEHGLTGIADKGGEFLVDDKKDGKPTAIEPRVPFLPELDTKQGTRRERLARWVTDPRNPNFSRATTNRVWALLFGRPLVEPIDDLPVHGDLPAALKILSEDFATHGFDLRRLISAVASTEAFSLDSATQDDSGPSSTLEAAWAAFPMTRLRPEQVAGALQQAASAEAIDAESHILVRLATYGGVNDFVARHGDPGEEEFHLEGSSTITQRLLMMNGDLVQNKIKDDLGNASTRIAMLAPDDPKAIEAAYLATLTRRPTPGEAAHFRASLEGTKGKERTLRLIDMIWSLLNSTEFSWDH